jgi:plasmid stabilization system protein ParE
LTQLLFAPGFLSEFERVTRHLLKPEVADVEQRLEAIFEALEILVRHPLVGRPVENRKRELVIGRGARGYVALYRLDPRSDAVVVLALRGQRERDFGSHSPQ